LLEVAVRTLISVPSWRGLPGPWLPVPFGGTGLGGIEIPDLLTPMTAVVVRELLVAHADTVDRHPRRRANMDGPPSRNHFQRLVAWACSESGGS
jgi:hypothetical protein